MLLDPVQKTEQLITFLGEDYEKNPCLLFPRAADAHRTDAERLVSHYTGATYLSLREALQQDVISISHNGCIETNIAFEELLRSFDIQKINRECGSYGLEPREEEKGNVGFYVELREKLQNTNTFADIRTDVLELIFDLPQDTFCSSIVDCHSGTSLSQRANTRVTRFLERALEENRKIFIRTADIHVSQKERRKVHIYNGFEI